MPAPTLAAFLRNALPPHRVLRNVFEEEFADRVLEYALANEERFEPATVGGTMSEELATSARVAAETCDLGPLAEPVSERVRALVPGLINEMKLSGFVPSEIELSMVQHGDGAFYKPHIDTFTHDSESEKRVRILSGVYYFHARPKAFSGGALRLFSLSRESHVDVPPDHNSLLVFPSWALHEVLPIRCPSRRFADSRFAINCWVGRTAV